LIHKPRLEEKVPSVKSEPEPEVENADTN